MTLNYWLDWYHWNMSWEENISATIQGLVLSTQKSQTDYSQLEALSACQSLRTVRCADIGLADMCLEGGAFERGGGSWR